MNRRQFLHRSGSAALLAATGCATSEHAVKSPTIIDCHTHFFDPTRPEGVHWPGRDSDLHRPTYPADYLAQPVPHPVAATVVVEASPRVEDNQWILDLARENPFIVGLCGNLDPLGGAFDANLGRFTANPLFRGIRIGGGTLQRNVEDGKFLARLAQLAERNLQLDVNGPPESLPAIQRLARAIPTLRIVIDHLANTAIDGRTVNAGWRRDMEAVAREPRVFAKVSGLVEAGARTVRPASVATDYYAGHLDVLWAAFGADRLVYGSNWPVSGLYAPLHDVQRIVTEYFSDKGRDALEKVFAGNARVAYGLS